MIRLKRQQLVPYSFDRLQLQEFCPGSFTRAQEAGGSSSGGWRSHYGQIHSFDNESLHISIRHNASLFVRNFLAHLRNACFRYHASLLIFKLCKRGKDLVGNASSSPRTGQKSGCAQTD